MLPWAITLWPPSCTCDISAPMTKLLVFVQIMNITCGSHRMFFQLLKCFLTNVLYSSSQPLWHSPDISDMCAMVSPSVLYVWLLSWKVAITVPSSNGLHQTISALKSCLWDVFLFLKWYVVVCFSDIHHGKQDWSGHDILTILCSRYGKCIFLCHMVIVIFSDVGFKALNLTVQLSLMGWASIQVSTLVSHISGTESSSTSCSCGPGLHSITHFHTSGTTHLNWSWHLLGCWILRYQHKAAFQHLHNLQQLCPSQTQWSLFELEHGRNL